MFTLNELKNVEKPLRYLGGETGEIIKSKHEILRAAVIVPEVYESAMMNQTMQRVYNNLNLIQDIWCERVFLPTSDFENLIRLNDNKLFTLESKTNIDEMNIILFIIDNEMQYIDALNILNLGKIPILKSRRDKSHPIVVFSGKGILNTKPVENFCDIFVIGEVDSVILEICERYIKYNGREDRKEYIAQLQDIEGVYLPGINKEVRYLKSKEFNYLPQQIHVIPWITNDFSANIIEISKGCPANCKMCQGAYIYKPMLEKQNVLKEVLEKKEFTGEKNIEFLTNCFACSNNIKHAITEIFSDTKLKNSEIRINHNTNIYLNKDNLWLLKYIGKGYIPKILVGGITENSKDILGISETKENIQYISNKIFESGFSKLKLVYVIGLPGENYDSLSKVLSIAEDIVNTYIEKYPNNSLTNIIDLRILNFSPRPFTKAERFEVNTPEKLELKLRYIVDKNTNQYINISTESPYETSIKTMLSRGDEKISDVIYDAWKNGARFQGGVNKASEEAWKVAIQKNKINMKEYLDRIDSDKNLPWGNIVI